MKSLYQFRLLDELKASDTQVRISQLIGRRNEDWSLRDVEFQNETVVLQNGDGSVFEMAFASASGGMLTFHKRGLNENNPPVEKEYNKKTWGNGTKCYVTAGAWDFIDKDEPWVWNGKQTFEWGIVVKWDAAFDRQIDAKRGVKNPTFASKEEANSFFSELEKVEGLLVNIKGNTYRWNSITKSWDMLGLADINQEKVQENSTKISTLEEKITTAERKINKFESVGWDHLEEDFILWEKYTTWDQLIPYKPWNYNSYDIEWNIWDIYANKEIHIQRIGSGTASNQLKLKMKKFWAPTTSVVVEVRKGIKVDVSDREAYRYGGEVVATTTIAYTEFTTNWKEFTLTLNNNFWQIRGELLNIVIYQEWGIVDAGNYYQIACLASSYSEAFSFIAVNWLSRIRYLATLYWKSDGFVDTVLIKKKTQGYRLKKNWSYNIVNNNVNISTFNTNIVLPFEWEYSYAITGSATDELWRAAHCDISFDWINKQQSDGNAWSNSLSWSKIFQKKTVALWLQTRSSSYNNKIRRYNINITLLHVVIQASSWNVVYPRTSGDVGSIIACTTFGRHVDWGWVAG